MALSWLFKVLFIGLFIGAASVRYIQEEPFSVHESKDHLGDFKVIGATDDFGYFAEKSRRKELKEIMESCLGDKELGYERLDLECVCQKMELKDPEGYEGLYAMVEVRGVLSKETSGVKWGGNPPPVLVVQWIRKHYSNMKFKYHWYNFLRMDMKKDKIRKLEEENRKFETENAKLKSDLNFYKAYKHDIDEPPPSYEDVMAQELSSNDDVEELPSYSSP
eukprot:s564_g29.t1